MSYLQRLIDRATGPSDPVHTRLDPVFPPLTPRVRDDRGGDLRPGAPAVSSPVAPAESPAEVEQLRPAPRLPATPAAPGAATAADAPGLQRRTTARVPTGPVHLPSPPGDTEARRASDVVESSAEPTAQETPAAPAAAERRAEVVVDRADPAIEPAATDGLVTARPAPVAVTTLPAPAVLSLMDQATPDLRTEYGPAPHAPIDVRIDTIEIVADGPAHDPSPPAVATGFADYAAVRSYEWGD